MFNIKNITIALLTVIAALFGGTKAYIDNQIQQKLNELNESTRHNIQLHYGTANLSWRGDMVIENVILQADNQPKVTIKKILLHQAYKFYDLKNSLPAHSHLELFGVNIDVPDTASEAPAILAHYKPYYLSLRELRQLGFPQFTMDVDIQAKQAPSNVDIVINVQGQRWANVHINATLLNIPLSPLEWLEKSEKIQLEQSTIIYKEKNLLQKISTFLARRNQQPEEIFKQQLAYQLRRDIESLRTQLEMSSIDNLAQFIQQPTQLQFIFQPAPPFPAYQTIINTPLQNLIQHLGFKIKYIP
jgi:hypothetical protein